MDMIGEHRLLCGNGQSGPVEIPADLFACGDLKALRVIIARKRQIVSDLKGWIFNGCFNGAFLPGQKIMTLPETLC